MRRAYKLWSSRKTFLPLREAFGRGFFKENRAEESGAYRHCIFSCNGETKSFLRNDFCSARETVKEESKLRLTENWK